MSIVIFDIDGTLADLTHRLHHIKNGNRDWNRFNENVHLDVPIRPIIALAQKLYQHHIIILASGRGEEVRLPTQKWLKENYVHYHELYMRPAGDYRKDTIIKHEILGQIRLKYGNDIELVVDDRQSVVDMWRANGLICLQAAAWDEEASVNKHFKKGLLTLMIGPSGAGKTVMLAQSCATGEFGIRREQIISSDNLREQLCDSFQDQSKNDQVFSAIHAIAAARIQHGLDTVIDATNIRRADRLAVVNATKADRVRYIVIDRPLEEKYATAGWRDPALLGFDLIAKHHSTFHSQIKDILKGDNIPNIEVIDLRSNKDK